MSVAVVAHRHDPSPFKHRPSHSQSRPPQQYAPQPQHSHRPSASASQQTVTHSTYDAFYGHEATAKICARYVSFTFACPEQLPAPPPQSTALEPSTRHPPIPPTLSHFVAYALHRTRLHPSVTYLALALLHRLKARFPAARGSSGHRLFLAAFMLASKVACDDTYSNKSWAVVGQGMFALREVNQMEREMCGYLAWALNVCGEELDAFEREIKRIFGKPGPYSNETTIRVSISSGVGGPKALRCPSDLDLAIPERAPHQLPTPTEAGPTAVPYPLSKPSLPPISTQQSASNRSQLPSPPESPPLSGTQTGSSNVTEGPSPASPEDDDEEDTSSDEDEDDDCARSPSPASPEESPLPTPPNTASSDPRVSATTMKRQHSLKYPVPTSQKLAKSSSLPGAMSSASTYAQQHAQARASVPPSLNSHYREPMNVTATHLGGTGIDALAGMEVDGVNARDLDDERRSGTAYFATTMRPHTSVGSTSHPSRTHIEKEMFAFSSASGAAAAGVKREREGSSMKDREAQKERERERERGREKEREREREGKKPTSTAVYPAPRDGWSGSNGMIVSSSSASSRQERDKRSLKTFTVPCQW